MTLFRLLNFRGLTIWLALFFILQINTAFGQTNTSTSKSISFPTNSYWTALPISPSIYNTPYHISVFNPQNGEDGARAWSQTKSVFFYGLGVVGVLAIMPESMTGWDTDTDIFGKWVDNVTDGPVWDRDNPVYNYVGHTYSGGVYYQVMRKSGYRQWDSFIYTFLMSSFYWEYGVEAFAETPSIQDLVVTPVLGWVYGEWAYQTELKIRDNDNTVIGSRALGNLSLFFLDPIDSLGRGVNCIARRKLVKAGSGYFSYTAVPTNDSEIDHTVYLNMKFPIGGSTEVKPDHKPSQFKFKNDPVDTGIVGFTVGTGHTFLDKKWNLEDDFFTQVSLGLYFTPSFSARVNYNWGDLKNRATKQLVNYENYSLDFQYYLATKHKLRPFITAGFGEQLWEEDVKLKSFQLNGGVGIHWQAFKKIAFQANWVNYYSFYEETYDQTVSAAFVYRFGHGEHDNW